MNKDQMHDLLFQALETEQGGILVYETALQCATNEDLREEWEQYLEQTKTHVDVLLNVFKKLGLNPGVETPGRLLVRQAAQSLIRRMQMALVSAKPAAAQIVAAECVVEAETKDHSNWELIGILSKELRGVEQEALRSAYNRVEEEEDEHLYHTQGLARELNIESLGLSAVLPPPEEKKDVKSAVEAAEVKKNRKATNGKREKVG